jgi:hypothetical protein
MAVSVPAVPTTAATLGEGVAGRGGARRRGPGCILFGANREALKRSAGDAAVAGNRIAVLRRRLADDDDGGEGDGDEGAGIEESDRKLVHGGIPIEGPTAFDFNAIG